MKTVQPDAIRKHSDLSMSIRNEMCIFENGGMRGPYFELVYGYLITIPPTSVEAERPFSAAGFIANKIRSRLGDDTIV